MKTPFEIQNFNNSQFGTIRTMVNESGETYFVAKDVALALGYNNTRDAVAKHVDKDDKTTVAIRDTGSAYKTQAVIINESGLYSLILSSQLPSAKTFKRWVTSEVLPQIRRTGGYIPTRNARTGKPLTDTGDRSNIVLPALLLCASIAIILVVVFTGKRARKKE